MIQTLLSHFDEIEVAIFLFKNGQLSFEEYNYYVLTIIDDIEEFLIFNLN